MILCLDCGNSRLKWGWLEGEQWRAKGALSLTRNLDGVMPTITAPERIIACNVAGERGRRAVVTLAKHWSTPIEWFAAAESGCGVINGYQQPLQLGADRWAALIGARAYHTDGALVVSAGTATTIDVLTVDGRFLGGLILPGLDLMRGALADATAGLPDASGQCVRLPKNTFDAMTSGAIFATVGAIVHMFRHLDDQPNALCLLTGGACAQLIPWLSIPCRRIDDLVLDGLRVFAECA